MPVAVGYPLCYVTFIAKLHQNFWCRSKRQMLPSHDCHPRLRRQLKKYYITG
jgi:hypothetical protein